jgi:hypothetical protein
MPPKSGGIKIGLQNFVQSESRQTVDLGTWQQTSVHADSRPLQSDLFTISIRP